MRKESSSVTFASLHQSRDVGSKSKYHVHRLKKCLNWIQLMKVALILVTQGLTA